MHEELPGDRDRELGHPCEVSLCCLTGAVLLREDDLLLWAVRGTPHLDPTLQRPQLPELVPLGVLLDEELEERLRLERRRLDEPSLDLRPVLDEGVFSRPPALSLTISDGSLPPETYFRPVFRSMPARIDARPMLRCLLISSINRLTCALVTARTRPASPSRGGPAPGRPIAPPRMGRSNCRVGGEM